MTKFRAPRAGQRLGLLSFLATKPGCRGKGKGEGEPRFVLAGDEGVLDDHEAVAGLKPREGIPPGEREEVGEHF